MKRHVVVISALAGIFLSLQGCSSKNTTVTQYAPTPASRILKLNSDFIARQRLYRDLEANSVIPIEARLLEPILNDNGAKFLLAIITYKGAKMDISIMGSNERGDGLPTTLPANFRAIQVDHREFKNKLRNSAKIPLGLTDFALVIKMEKDGFVRMRGLTGCKYFLFYPSIESGWHKDNVADANTDEHFTLSVLASKSGSRDINDLHYRTLDGEETWPEENFSWYSKPTERIVIPEP